MTQSDLEKLDSPSLRRKVESRVSGKGKVSYDTGKIIPCNLSRKVTFENLK